MPKAQQDTEITLGTGRMLVIFFSFVLVCAFFFAIGFSLGRKTSVAAAGSSSGSPVGMPATVVRPSAAKNGAPQPAPQPDNFGFYKAVGEKNANASLTPQQSKTQPSAAITQAPTSGADTTAKDPAVTASGSASASAAGSYYVQVAAVTRQEDAQALVEALKKKQYPAFSANNPVVDKFYRVQVGPYIELKEAEAMRARLVGDGYNPIVKK
jgi:DedD protein